MLEPGTTARILRRPAARVCLGILIVVAAAAALGPLATAAGNAAQALIGHGPTAPIHGLSATGIPGLTLDHTAFALRGIA